MKIKGYAVALIFLAGFSANAKAGLLDVRVGAGISAANPDAFEDRVNTLSGSDLSADNFDTFNADAVIRFPVLPLTLGVRYEQASQDQSAGSSEWDMDVNNLSVLAGWRLINSKVYVGPVVGVGYPWGKVDFKGGPSNVSRQIDRQQLSYSGALEAGIYLGSFLVGAEAGYKSIHLKGGASDPNIKLDGFYGKALIGFTFL